SANDFAQEHAEEYNAKLMVFQTFCVKFHEATYFFGIWKRELSGSGPTTPKVKYSSIAAISLPAAHVCPRLPSPLPPSATTAVPTIRSTSSPRATVDHRPLPIRPPYLHLSRSRSPGQGP
ncbi:hypothetical protein FOFC_13659, partial [Fusarium oxysporum]